MAIFDITKPATSTRLNSQQLRDNFTALGRANDLRCRASDPADLNVNVEPGVFSVSSTTATQFDGDFVTIDTETGGAVGQERVFVVEMSEVTDGYGDVTGELVLNTSGMWAPAGTATAPNFTTGNIGLCTVLVAYQDTEITDSQITDVRPIVNLGSAAIPPTGLALADLSDVDGNQSAAFAAADSPTALNPFLTPTTAPIPTIQSNISTLQTDVSGHFAGSSDRHTAADVNIVDNFTFSNASDLQEFADDVENNIFQEFLDEHLSTGEHGPKVTINQTNNDNALTISGASAADIMTVSDSGTATGRMLQITADNTNGGSSVRLVCNRTSPAFRLEKDGEGPGISILHNATTSGQNAIFISTTNTTSNATPSLVISHAPPSGNAMEVDVKNFGISVTATTGASSSNYAYFASGVANIIGYRADMSATSVAPGVRVTQASTTTGTGIQILKTGAGSGAAISITNSGSGNDIVGNLSRWSVNAMGHSSFGNVRAGAGSGVNQGFLVLTEGAALTITIGGLITPTHSFHEVRANTGTSDQLDNIEVSGVPDGTILILKPLNGHTITIRDRQGGSGEIHLNNAVNISFNVNDRITLQKDGSDWYQVALFSNNA